METFSEVAKPGVIFESLPKRYKPSKVLEICVKETESVALDRSMVGISDPVVQYRVFLLEEPAFEEPQAVNASAARQTPAAWPIFLGSFIVSSPYLHYFRQHSSLKR